MNIEQSAYFTMLNLKVKQILSSKQKRNHFIDEKLDGEKVKIKVLSMLIGALMENASLGCNQCMLSEIRGFQLNQTFKKRITKMSY